MQSTIPDKIGVGLITCDREDFFKISYKALEHNYDISFVVVDDGKETSVRDLIDFTEDGNVHYIKTKGKEGVGAAKNKALHHLMMCGCEHIFLLEDDVEILDKNIFNSYIKASKSTGIKHFNFGLHGNHNKDIQGNPTIKKTINYPDGTQIVLYPNILGALSYYHIDTLKSAGLMDEQFYNALEHVDHTYQIIKEGYHPPFRWFADISNAEQMILDIVPDHQQSKIRSQEDFMKNFFENHERFVKKNNFSVVYGHGPAENEYTEDVVVEHLKEIWKRHAQK
jgi:GT2 family glycosyltransferase